MSGFRGVVFCGVSLDGFIARRDGRFDFLAAGGEASPEDTGFTELMASVDALVMGRATYDVVRGFGAEWPYGDTLVVVLSSRPLEPPPDGARVEHMAGSPSEIAAALVARGLPHVYVDGGATIQSFLRAGLIERIVVTRVPVLIGSGIALFGPLDADVALHHVATRTLAGGAVQSEYRVRSAIS